MKKLRVPDVFVDGCSEEAKLLADIAKKLANTLDDDHEKEALMQAVDKVVDEVVLRLKSLERAEEKTVRNTVEKNLAIHQENAVLGGKKQDATDQEEFEFDN